jgi:hypothetical protein
MDCKSHILVTMVWSPNESTPLISRLLDKIKQFPGEGCTVTVFLFSHSGKEHEND